jgi:hypothetical protein
MTSAHRNNSSNTTDNAADSAPPTCSNCGRSLAHEHADCPQCTDALEALYKTTVKLGRTPTVVPSQPGQTTTFSPHTCALLQVLPSGACVTLDVKRSLLLGRYRKPAPDVAAQVFDLTPYRAREHGVSRQHCLLKLRDDRLMITDLGSTNGTYLNGKRLAAHTDLVVADGDKLILGSLHLTVFFATDSPPA